MGEAKGLPRWHSGEKSACRCRRCSWIPGAGRSPGGSNGSPLQYSCGGNSVDRGTWQAAVHGVTKESDTTEHTHPFYRWGARGSGRLRNLLLCEVRIHTRGGSEPAASGCSLPTSPRNNSVQRITFLNCVCVECAMCHQNRLLLGGRIPLKFSLTEWT